jgi:hypothetical protein
MEGGGLEAAGVTNGDGSVGNEVGDTQWEGMGYCGRVNQKLAAMWPS